MKKQKQSRRPITDAQLSYLIGLVEERQLTPEVQQRMHLLGVGSITDMTGLNMTDASDLLQRLKKCPRK